MIIKESDIEIQKEIISSSAINIESDVQEITNLANSLEETIIGLSVCMNTTGGSRRIKKLGNIELDTKALNQIAADINKIDVSYQKVRKDL